MIWIKVGDWGRNCLLKRTACQCFISDVQNSKSISSNLINKKFFSLSSISWNFMPIFRQLFFSSHSAFCVPLRVVPFSLFNRLQKILFQFLGNFRMVLVATEGKKSSNFSKLLSVWFGKHFNLFIWSLHAHIHISYCWRPQPLKYRKKNHLKKMKCVYQWNV